MTFTERIATLPEFLMRLWWVWLLFGIWGFLNWILEVEERTQPEEPLPVEYWEADILARCGFYDEEV